MTILPKKKQRKEKNESDSGSEAHHHHQHPHHHHLHHGNLHVDPGGHIPNPPGADGRGGRLGSAGRGSATGTSSTSAINRNVASGSLGSPSLSSGVGGRGWASVAETAGEGGGAEARDSAMDHQMGSHFPVAPAATHGSSVMTSSKPYVTCSSPSVSPHPTMGQLHPGAAYHGHKKRHRASPHTDSEVRSFYHQRHNPTATASSDHGTSLDCGVSDHPEDDPGNQEDDGEIDAGNLSGNNSEDEYYQSCAPTEDVEEVEKVFEKALKEQKGFSIRKTKEDGACLFRAIADQVYGDQDMHDSIRRLCMDYMVKNKDYYSQYITEDFDEYIARKRHPHCHGNYIEMQAISEMFNRPIEVYQVPENAHQYFYRLEPINIFHGHMKTDNEPLRISYHRSVHYNSVVHPYKATIGVGLGLPSLNPGLAEHNLMHEASRISERSHIEQTMFEDKIKETDWEATNEAIEEQVARESYLQWLQDQEKQARQKEKGNSRSATATSTSTSASCSSSSLGGLKNATSGGRSPRGGHSPPHPPFPAHTVAPRAGMSPSHPLTNADGLTGVSQSLTSRVASPRHSPPHRGLQSPGPSTSSTRTPPGGRSPQGGAAGGRVPFNDTPSTFLGFNDWVSDEAEGDIMAQVLAMSQREYFEAQMTSSLTSSLTSSAPLSLHQMTSPVNSMAASRIGTPPPSSSSREAACDATRSVDGPALASHLGEKGQRNDDGYR